MRVYLVLYKNTEKGIHYTHADIRIASEFNVGVDLWISPKGLNIAIAEDKSEACETQILLDTIDCGETVVTEDEAIALARQIYQTFGSYNLLTSNCRHFATEMIKQLNPGAPDEALRRLASLNTKCTLLVYLAKQSVNILVKELMKLFCTFLSRFATQIGLSLLLLISPEQWMIRLSGLFHEVLSRVSNVLSGKRSFHY